MRTGTRTLSAARRLRREMTLPEVLLWQRLKQTTDGAPRFRRQHPIGPYVLDFYCPAARLAVEVDGWGHNMGEQPGRDERRDAWLAERGVTVVRITASDVLADADSVADVVVRQGRVARVAPSVTALKRRATSPLRREEKSGDRWESILPPQGRR